MKISRIQLLTTIAVAMACSCASTHAGKSQVQRGASLETADAIIRVCADKAGRPYDISIVRAANDNRVRKAIINAAKSWKFPATNSDGTQRQECEDIPVQVQAAG